MIDVFLAAETLAEKTRFYWPYMTISVIGACLVSLFIICCCCHQIRRAMYNKRKAKGNFDSKRAEFIDDRSCLPPPRSDVPESQSSLARQFQWETIAR